jgi:hypothetical protein
MRPITLALARIATPIALGAGLGLAAAPASAQVLYSATFDDFANTQGWWASNALAYTQAPIGGSPGGFFLALDSLCACATPMSANVSFGSGVNWSAATGGTFGLSLRYLSQGLSGPVNREAFGTVTLLSGSNAVSRDLFPSSTVNGANGGWVSASSLLSPAGWSGNATLAQVLGNVTGIRIDIDPRSGGFWVGGVGEKVGLDNVVVTAVPEPHEWALMLAGLGLVGWAARRRSTALAGSPATTPA